MMHSSDSASVLNVIFGTEDVLAQRKNLECLLSSQQVKTYLHNAALDLFSCLVLCWLLSVSPRNGSGVGGDGWRKVMGEGRPSFGPTGTS